MAERRPRLTNPRRYRLREALEAVGRRRFGQNWDSGCIDAPQRPPLEILRWAPLDRNADLDRPEDTNTPPVTPRRHDPELQRAWEQREAAQHYLTEIIRDGGVSVWLDVHGGRRRRIEPDEWEASGGLLKIYYMSGLGEFRGGEWGELFIDADELNSRLKDVPQNRGQTNPERREQTKERNALLQHRADEIMAADSSLTKRQIAKKIYDKLQLSNHRDQGKSLTLESIERIIRLPKCKRRARRAP